MEVSGSAWIAGSFSSPHSRCDRTLNPGPQRTAEHGVCDTRGVQVTNRSPRSRDRNGGGVRHNLAWYSSFHREYLFSYSSFQRNTGLAACIMILKSYCAMNRTEPIFLTPGDATQRNIISTVPNTTANLAWSVLIYCVALWNKYLSRRYSHNLTLRFATL